MRSGISLLAVALVLGGVSFAQPLDVGAAELSAAPWHHKSVSRLDQARPGKAAEAEAGPQKYLHIEMQYNDSSVLQSRDKFRIVDERGNEVGDNWGWHDKEKLMVFEGHWGSLQGLYLEGNGHREPLFEQARIAVAPRPVVATPVVEVPRTYVQPPVMPPTVVTDRRVYVEPRRDGVVDDRRDVLVDDRRDLVVTGGDL